MKQGLVRVASATPVIRVADCHYNAEQVIGLIQEAENKGCKVLVLPELCLTGYTCSDLFLQELLWKNAEAELLRIAGTTLGKDVFTVVGLPFVHSGKLYNVAACVQNGKVLGFVPKQNIPNYSEFYEARHFTKGPKEVTSCLFNGEIVPFGANLLFCAKQPASLVIGVEICEDLWVAQPPSGGLAEAGALVICNLSASDEVIGKADYRRQLVKGQSARLVSGYLYADAGEGESTTDLVFSGHNLIAENGCVLVESVPFRNSLIFTELDLERLQGERRKITTYSSENRSLYTEVSFSLPSITAGTGELPSTQISRMISKTPFVPSNESERKTRCNEIMAIQAFGLKKRLSHTNCSRAVIGISGGLDSTLALLVTKKAFELLSLPLSGILAVTMPCFGTTNRTYQNAVRLAQEIGCTLREVRINEAVELHFRDIGQDKNRQDVTYENAQARERTQVLMDLANQYGGLVIGTGDLSELALGWATYNGDHMSMYGVNASIPKTLVRYLVKNEAEEAEAPRLREVLEDVLDTPVSPELLPPQEGTISQITEDLVGPYELHDFYLYYVMRLGFRPEKVYRMACTAFAGYYENEVILHWLKVFYKRFFTSQFKRSCLPDGPKVGSVALSPRGDWRMPSDACATAWLAELDEI